MGIQTSRKNSEYITLYKMKAIKSIAMTIRIGRLGVVHRAVKREEIFEKRAKLR